MVAEQHRADAFDLAARVQEELGNETHVWCGAGEGVDMFPENGETLVVAAGSTGTTLEQRSGRRLRQVTTGSAGGREGTARAIVRWRAMTPLAGAPFGTAETRAQGLRAAGHLQRDVGKSSQVIFFAGAHSPDDYSAGLDSI